MLLFKALVFLLPALAVLGAEVENYTGSTVILLTLVILISLFPILIAATKNVPEGLLPFAVMSVSLSLVLHQALISQHLWGSDIQIEYYYFHQVIATGAWNPSVVPANAASQGYSATLSVTILPTVLSMFSGVKGMWIFKIVFPAIYSTTPLLLFLMCRRELGPRLAFMASFVFASIPSFYEVDLTLGKQMIATLLLALALLAMTKKESRVKIPLLLLLGFGVIDSHYSSGLYLVVLLTLTALLLRPRRVGRLSLLYLVGLLWAFYLLWYAFVSNGFIIGFFVNDIASIGSSLQYILNPASRYSLVLLAAGPPTPVYQTTKILNVAFQVLIAVGILRYLYNKKMGGRQPFGSAFAAAAIVSFSFLIVAIVLPFFSAFFDVERLYTLTLLLLAPFGIYGGAALSKLIGYPHARSRTLLHWEHLLAIFLGVFLLFNVGLVSAISNEPYPSAFSLVPNSSYALYNQGEYYGGLWFVSYSMPHTSVFMDENSAPLFLSLAYVSIVNFLYLTNGTSIDRHGEMLFLNSWNLRNGVIQGVSSTALGSAGVPEALSLRAYDRYIQQSGRLYDSNYDRLYQFP